MCLTLIVNIDDADFEGVCILTLYNVSMDHKVRPKFIPTDIIPKVDSEYEFKRKYKMNDFVFS